MCLLHVNPFLLRLRSEIRHRFPPAAHRKFSGPKKICFMMECTVFTCEFGLFGCRVKHSRLVLCAAWSRFSVLAHMLPLRHSTAREEGTILSAPYLIAPVTIIHLREKKKAFHLWSSCSSMQCPSRVHLASSVCVRARVLRLSNTCVCYLLIYVHANIQRVIHARWKLPVRKSNSSRGVSLLHVFSDEIGGGASWNCQQPPECAIVGMRVCVREVGKFLGRTLCPCVFRLEKA